MNVADYINKTDIHPLGLIALIILGLTTMMVKRRHAMVPILTLVCIIAPAQRIVLFTLDFNFWRIILLFGMVRVLLRKEYNVKWCQLDLVILIWSISSCFIYTLRYGNSEALINRFGFLLDYLFTYYLFRCLLRDWHDIDRLILGAIVISVPIALAFIYEHMTAHNIFSIFGGVPEITYIREGLLRCQGAFPHPIVAGCFWATLTPLFFVYGLKSMQARVLSLIGLSSSLVIVYTCSSSTPILVMLIVFFGGVLFWFRRYMRMIRWGLLLLVISLHLIMSLPVWHLISRVGLVHGSTSYHRYVLIDQAINRIGEWWLLGTNSTAHWFWGMEDVTNQYVYMGINGGLVTLICFIGIIVISFKGIGQVMKMNVIQKNRYYLVLTWAIGVSLFSHTMSFLGLCYFGQLVFVWNIILAMIGSLTSMLPSTKTTRSYRKSNIAHIAPYPTNKSVIV